MKLLLFLLLVSAWLLPTLLPAKDVELDPELTKQVGEILQQTQQIKVGGNRSDLEKFFRVAGGLSFGKTLRYESRACPYVKIDVVFDAPTSERKPVDTITSISKPYLDIIAYD